MKKKYNLFAILFLFTLTFLGGCGQSSVEDPEMVIDKAKQAIVDLKSGDVTVSAKASGGNQEDTLDFDGNFNLMFDQRDESDHKTNLSLEFSGKMKAGEKTLDGDVDLNFINLGKEYYVKLNKLSSSDPSLAQIKPFVDLYVDKWLRIDENFIPENIRDLQGDDEAMKLKKTQLEELFVSTKLFDVNKEYDVEKLNGESVYHYGLKPNADAFKDYLTKASIIDGREMTAKEIEESLKILEYVNDIQVYIDTDEYFVPKSIFRFSGAALNQDANLDLEVTVDGADFNQDVTIEAPEGAEDFNPLNLMMGMGGVPALPADEQPASDASGIQLEGSDMSQEGPAGEQIPSTEGE